MLYRDIYQIIYKYISYESKLNFKMCNFHINKNNISFKNLSSHYRKIIDKLKVTGILAYKKEGEETDFKNGGVRYVSESEEYIFQDYDYIEICDFILKKMWLLKKYDFNIPFKMMITDVHDERLIINCKIGDICEKYKPAIIHVSEATEDDYDCANIYIYEKEDRSDLVKIIKKHHETTYKPTFGHEYFDSHRKSRHGDIDFSSEIIIYTKDEKFKDAIIQKFKMYVTYVDVNDIG